MYKVKSFLFVGFVLLAMAGVLGGCDSDPDPDPPKVSKLVPDGLLGKWNPDNLGGDWYNITRSGTTETVNYGFGEDIQWGGIVRSVIAFDDQTGVIIIELNEIGYKDPAKLFTAVYYLNFTANTSVELNMVMDATAADWNADAATLQEAKDKFTMDDMENYIDLSYSSSYSRE